MEININKDRQSCTIGDLDCGQMFERLNNNGMTTGEYYIKVGLFSEWSEALVVNEVIDEHDIVYFCPLVGELNTLQADILVLPVEAKIVDA